jgi:hypothetical protein
MSLKILILSLVIASASGCCTNSNGGALYGPSCNPADCIFLAVPVAPKLGPIQTVEIAPQQTGIQRY